MSKKMTSQMWQDEYFKSLEREKLLIQSSKNLLEWAKGLRGSKHHNPYLVPEVEEMIRLLGTIDGWEGSWEDYPTDK